MSESCTFLLSTLFFFSLTLAKFSIAYKTTCLYIAFVLFCSDGFTCREAVKFFRTHLFGALSSGH